MSTERMHHINCEKGEIGRYVLLPGDPGRVEKIAAFLDNPRYLTSKREYTIWNGELDGELITVMSTGMGGPSTAIGIEELKLCGADTLVRIGTCGGINPELIPGTLIIPTGAIRKEGTTREYVPIEYPAVPNYEVVFALQQAADRLKLPFKLGVSESKDSFYGQHNPDSMPVSSDLKQKWKAWQMAGAEASEMECAALFIVASVRRMRAAAVLNLCRNVEREITTGIADTDFDTTNAIRTAIEALRILINEDRIKHY